MIKITFSNTKDVAGIFYKSGDLQSQFIGKIYLDADLGRPSYIYEEDGEEDINGNFKRTFARVVKQYRITTHLMEYMIDALSVVQLHDEIMVFDSNGEGYVVDEFKMSDPEWDDAIPCLAEVTLTFNVYSETTFSNCN